MLDLSMYQILSFNLIYQNVICQTKKEKNFSVPIKVEYDKSFKKAYGDKSLFAVRGLLAIVQNIFRWSSWKVKLNFRLVTEIRYNKLKSFELEEYLGKPHNVMCVKM